MVFKANTRNETDQTTFDQSNVKGYGKLCQKLVSFLCTILFEVTWAFGIFTWTMFKTTDANFDAVF